MKPEYIGIGNFDENNYVYAYCKCPLPSDYAIKWPRIKDGKPHSYTCICENCGAEVSVSSKSYRPDDFDLHKFIEEHFEPVENKPGYVWFSKRNMLIINTDVLAANIEKELFTKGIKYGNERGNVSIS